MKIEEMIEMNLYRKILILAINEIVQRESISLKFIGNYMPNDDEYGHIFADLAGVPSVIMWDSISHGELRVSVWWNYDHSKNPAANSVGYAKEHFLKLSPKTERRHYRKFVGATVTAWLERKDGRFIQGIGERGLTGKYMRQTDRSQLQALPTPVPQGYRAEGKFHM